MTATLLRLAFSGIRSRLLASGLTVLLAGAAAATLVLALQIGDTGRDPWQRTFDAAHGAHVLALLPSEDQAVRLRQVAGVVEAGVPVAIAVMGVRLATGDHAVPLWLVGSPAPPTVNTPVRITGTTTPAGGIVLEQSLASALHADVGTRLTVAGPGGRRAALPVVGTAVVPSQGRYPRANPGIAWVSPSTLQHIQPDRRDWRWVVGLRLGDPDSAAAVAASIGAGSPPGTVAATTWQEQRADVGKDAQPFQLLLTMYAVILLAVAFAVVTILVGARALQQHREIGLLKAVGLTPRQVSAVFVTESAVLGLVGSALGFGVGTLLAPRLSRASAQSLLGSPTIAAHPSDLLVATIPVVLVLAASSWLSTRRRTRYPVLQAIEAGRGAPPTAASLLARYLRLVPRSLTLAVGSRSLLTGRTRVALLTTAISLTGATFVFALSMQESLARQPKGTLSDVPTDLPAMVYALDAVLLLVSATALLAVALFSIRERLRDFAVLKTVGFTPRQVAATLVSPFAGLALVAGIISVPLGLALYVGAYHLAGGEGTATLASWPALTLVPIATVLVVLLATAVPARIATRAPAAAALRAE
jgi:putative ABC transport system permease protein